MDCRRPRSTCRPGKPAGWVPGPAGDGAASGRRRNARTKAETSLAGLTIPGESFDAFQRSRPTRRCGTGLGRLPVIAAAINLQPPGQIARVVAERMSASCRRPLRGGNSAFGRTALGGSQRRTIALGHEQPSSFSDGNVFIATLRGGKPSFPSRPISVETCPVASRPHAPFSRAGRRPRKLRCAQRNLGWNG
jgi:hypothetical protein